MRQARDLLYRKVHLGSNPNPGASLANSSSGVPNQMFYSLMAGQPRLVRMKVSLAQSSICLVEMPLLAASTNTRGHSTHTTFRPTIYTSAPTPGPSHKDWEVGQVQEVGHR